MSRSMSASIIVKQLNRMAEDPRNGFYTHGLARETLPLWEKPEFRSQLSEHALNAVEWAEMARAEGC